MIKKKVIYQQNDYKDKVLQLIKNNLGIIIFIVLIISTAFINANILSVDNLLKVLRQTSIIGIITLGVSWMLISGSFDLSVGSIVSLVNVAVIWMIVSGYGTFLAIVAGIVIGLLCGLVNGLLVGWLKVNAMICTLGTLTVYQGLALMVSGGRYLRIKEGNRAIAVIGQGSLLGIAIPIWIFLILTIIMYSILSKTIFGKRIYLIGDNENSARLVGIRVAPIRIITYMVTGITSAIAGIIISGRILFGYHFVGLGFEFDAITAAVLGGVYLSGGIGTVGHAVLGAGIISYLANAQTIIGVDVYTQMLIKALIFLLVVGIQANIKRRSL